MHLPGVRDQQAIAPGPRPIPLAPAPGPFTTGDRCGNLRAMSENGWQIAFDRAPVNVVPQPACSFDLYGNLMNSGEVPRIPLVLETAVFYLNRRIKPPALSLLDGRALERGQGTRIRLTVEFTRDLLGLIESGRAGGDRVELRVDASVLGVRGQGFEREHIDHLQDEPYVVSRDTWLAILETFEYGESEVFELPLRAIQLVPGYENALLGLNDAERALADKNWRLVLIKLWNVFEAVGAASAAGQGGSMSGFEPLIREALPHEHYKEVRPAVASLIAYLRLFQQRFMEAYGDEHIPVTREDALFAFEMTLSILAYLTKRMAAR